MAKLRFPDSMDECVYFTRRAVDSGKVVCWVFKEKCPKCGKAFMGKPTGPDGKVKIRAKEYVCPSCNHTVEKVAYEDTLTANVQYTCPKCKNSGEITTPYKRKTFQGMKAIVFQCEKCSEKIPITKKLKGVGDSDDDDDV